MLDKRKHKVPPSVNKAIIIIIYYYYMKIKTKCKKIPTTRDKTVTSAQS